jgi:protein TIF31
VKSCEDSICFSVVNGNSVDTPLQNGHVDATPGRSPPRPPRQSNKFRFAEKQTKDAEESEKKELDESKSKDEVVFIQDVGFSVKIVSPGAEPLRHPSVEHGAGAGDPPAVDGPRGQLPQDVLLAAARRQHFGQLRRAEEHRGAERGSLIRVVEEPYTMREARIHVRHVRDLLKSLDPADAYNGTECSSLSFLNTVTQGDILEKKKMRPESVDCTPPDYIMPDSKDRPLTALQPQLKDQKVAQCVKVLTTSAWNPPPGYRKIHGDLMYLYVVTLEDKHYYISACSRGFYINQ